MGQVLNPKDGYYDKALSPNRGQLWQSILGHKPSTQKWSGSEANKAVWDKDGEDPDKPQWVNQQDIFDIKAVYDDSYFKYDDKRVDYNGDAEGTTVVI